MCMSNLRAYQFFAKKWSFSLKYYFPYVLWNLILLKIPAIEFFWHCFRKRKGWPWSLWPAVQTAYWSTMITPVNSPAWLRFPWALKVDMYPYCWLIVNSHILTMPLLTHSGVEFENANLLTKEGFQNLSEILQFAERQQYGTSYPECLGILR